MSTFDDTVRAIYEYADAYGGKMPTEWRVHPDDFEVLVVELRRLLEKAGRSLIDGRGVVVEGREVPDSVMVIGVPVLPVPLTPKHISGMVARIALKVDDEEVAHMLEDRLHQKVLRAIADGTCADPSGCARAALETSKLQFARHCA
jgi:hypothetical protein